MRDGDMDDKLPTEVEKALEEALSKLGDIAEEKGRPTDNQLAQRWIDRHLDHRFGLGKMRRYRAGHWPALDDEEFERSVLDMLAGEEERGLRVSDRTLRSVARLIQAYLAIPAHRWDSNPDIIVCANGTLDLTTYTLREHRPDDYATMALDYAYDPDATCPTFERVLQDSLPSDATGFLREFAGYCLTTSTEHEIAVWLYGPPGSGKSTIVDGLTAMLGPKVGTLSLAELEQSRFALGDIAGRTLLVATEQPALYVRCTHTLNALISGERVKVERKYQHPLEITPTAKLLWAMNSLPRADAGSGLFRRTKIVPCRPVAQPDPGIKAAVRAERAGILNWALEGLRRLRERGRFEIPPSVQEASRLFQAANDIPAQFLAERCELGDDYRISASQLYDAYRTWCAANGHLPASSTSAAEHWQRLGLTRYRAGGATFYRGARLRDAT